MGGARFRRYATFIQSLHRLSDKRQVNRRLHTGTFSVVPWQGVRPVTGQHQRRIRGSLRQNQRRFNGNVWRLATHGGRRTAWRAISATCPRIIRRRVAQFDFVARNGAPLAR